jgi:hypothetical protein
MAETILNDDWSDYDDPKIRDNRDSRFFSCEEKWERDYLIGKIQKHYPRFTSKQIEDAIDRCCITIATPRPRRTFVECVMKRLRG